MARLSELNCWNCFPSRFIAISAGASCGDSETALRSLTISSGGTTMLVTTVAASHKTIIGAAIMRMTCAIRVGVECPTFTLP